jgi:hypothetical protein
MDKVDSLLWRAPGLSRKLLLALFLRFVLMLEMFILLFNSTLLEFWCLRSSDLLGISGILLLAIRNDDFSKLCFSASTLVGLGVESSYSMMKVSGFFCMGLASCFGTGMISVCLILAI